MSEIQTLTKQVQEIGESAGRWVTAGQWLTLMAAVAALLYWWASSVALKKSNAHSEAQFKLGKAKDEAFALQLGEASAGLAKANLEIEDRKQENLTLEQSNLELLTSIVPRNLQWSALGGRFNEQLKLYAGERVVIEFLPEAEPRRAAESLAQELRSAGWEVEGPLPNEELWRAWHIGVRLEPYRAPSHSTFPSEEEFREHVNAMWKSSELSDCIESYLNKRKWQGVGRGWPEDGELAKGTLRIRIGSQPMPELPRTAPLGLDDEHRQFLIDEGLIKDDSPVPLERKAKRSIGVDDRAKMVELLKLEREGYAHLGQQMEQVEIRCPDGNCEAYELALQIADVLSESGWEVRSGKVVVDRDFDRKLKDVVVRADSKNPQQHFQAADLLRALQKAEIESKDVWKPTFDPLQVLVGW